MLNDDLSEQDRLVFTQVGSVASVYLFALTCSHVTWVFSLVVALGACCTWP